MNKSSWLEQLAALRQPVSPPPALWQRIEQHIEASTSRVRTRHAATPWLLAASLAAVTFLALGVSHQRPPPNWAHATPAWKPTDPRLAGAAIELNAAQLELRQALRQAPSSAALQQLLQRTERQQARLRHFELEAG